LTHSPFSLKAFLGEPGPGRAIGVYTPNQILFTQGDTAEAVYYIQRGKVKLTVVSSRGKEAIIAILGPGDFLGEACLQGKPYRTATASTMSGCSVMRLEAAALNRAMHEERALADMFLQYLLTRNSRIEEDLTDQLFNSSEKRLARVLLILANFGLEGEREPVVLKISQQTLAGIVGTTRSRISFFLSRFRKQNFIDYQNGLIVNRSLLNFLLHND
jgi:CRP/FNR family transcriptional regulator, cyclic AMP receptor protein